VRGIKNALLQPFFSLSFKEKKNKEEESFYLPSSQPSPLRERRSLRANIFYLQVFSEWDLVTRL